MANETTNKTLVWCTRDRNETCWNHQVSILNAAHAQQMTPVIVMMSLFMVVGILGNSIVIVMYRSKKEKTSANIFVMFLAGIDMFACVVIHPYIIYKILFFYNQTWSTACKIFEFFIHFNLLLSALTLLLIAIDRFLAICRPVKYLRFDHHVVKSVYAICVMAFITSIPILEFYGQSPLQYHMRNTIFVGYICHYRQVYIGSPSMAIFSGFVMFGFLVEIVAMSILYKHVAVVAYRSRRAIGPMPNVRLLKDIKSSPSFTTIDPANCTRTTSLTVQLGDVTPSSSRNYPVRQTQNNTGQSPQDASKLNTTHELFLVNRHMSVGLTRTTSMAKPQFMEAQNEYRLALERQSIEQLKSKRLKAAKILFLVTFAFVLSWLPFFVIRICNAATHDKCHPQSYVGEVFDSMLNHVFYINNAINPILYAIINNTFRDEFRGLLRRRLHCNV